MTWLRVVVSRLIGLFRKGRQEPEFDRELHFQMEGGARASFAAELWPSGPKLGCV
jgi:hypothetical protein